MACGMPLQIQEIKLIIRCLLQGVVEITERGIIHRDIKIENILLMIDPVTQLVTDAVLADFGLHSLVSDWESRNCNRGSHAYVPPEHASVWLNPETGMIGEVITTRCDDWAIGLTLLLLLKPYVTEWRAFTLPWAQSVKATSPDHYIALIRKMLEELCALQPDWLPEVSGNPVATAVRNLLHPDPAKRWKAATALAFLEEDAKRQDAAKVLMSLGKRR
jgi:serine/threonine protein kinase